MNIDLVYSIIIICCIIFSAYFSATETAFSSLNRIRIKNMAEKGDKRALLVMRLYQNYDGLLSTILIGNNIVNIASASLATVLFVKLFGNESGPGISTAVTTIVVLIFGEISPKSIAKESPEKIAMMFSPLLNLLMKILFPFNYIFLQWKKLLSKIFKSTDASVVTEEELITIIEEAEEGGGIDEQESEIIQNAIEFSELSVSDILTPRIDITAISTESTKEEIANVFSHTQFSRVPVYEGSIDHINGIISHKDFYNYIYNTDEEIKSIIRPAIFITGNKKLGELLKDFQAQKLHMAIVVDEYGETDGIVTLEDVLEEIVGEIWDEHDEVVKKIEKISDSEFIVSGMANAEKIFEDLGIHSDMTALTISGCIMNNLGRIPDVGDVTDLYNMRLEVISMNGKRVGKAKITIPNADKSAEKL